MKTYSMFATPLEVIENALPHKYSMELNKSDMINLLQALESAADTDCQEAWEWAVGFRSSILTTIGIEEI